MKKYFLLLACISLFLTGCTKNYKNVDKYEKDMMTVQSTFPSFHISGRITGDRNVEFSTYIKGDKWKEEMKGSDFDLTTIYDGKEATMITPNNVFKFPKIRNSVTPLLNWFDSYGQTDINKNFVNNKTQVNGMDCRMIQYKSNRTINNQSVQSNFDICVSDKYGVAVSYKSDIKTGDIVRKENIEVTEITTLDIPDSMFKVD